MDTPGSTNAQESDLRDRILEAVVFHSERLAQDHPEASLTMTEILAISDRVFAQVVAANVGDPIVYAGQAGYNAAVDKLRRKARGERSHAADIAAAELRGRDNERDLVDYNNWALAQYEFDDIVARVKGGLTETMCKAIDLLRMMLFDGQTEAGLEKAFPGTRYQQRQMWRNRAKKIVEQFASENLRGILAQRNFVSTVKRDLRGASGVIA